MEEGGILEQMGKLLVQGKKRRLMSIDRVEMTQTPAMQRMNMHHLPVRSGLKGKHVSSCM